MNFRPELAAKVMTGEKTVTRRLTNENPNSPWWIGGCGLVVGRDYAVCPGRSKPAIGRVVVVSVERRDLGYIGDREARAEGFADEAEFIAAWKSINGHYEPFELVWRIGMEVVAR